MGRASRKTREAVLQQYRDAGWDDESLRIWFGGELPASKKSISFFRHPRHVISDIMSGKSVSPARYGEILSRADWEGAPVNIEQDPVFKKIFQEEMRRLSERDNWIDRFDQDLLRQEFAGLLGPRPPRLLEAAAEIDPQAFRHAAKDIKSRQEPQQWAREEFQSGLTRILEKQGSKEWLAARHEYLRAVWGLIQKEVGQSWPLEIEAHLLCIKGLLRQGSGSSDLFDLQRTEEGLLPEEALLRDAVRSFTGALHDEKMDADRARAKIVPLVSRQIFSQLLQRPVENSESAAEEIAAQYFFPGVRRKRIGSSPFENLRPIFRAESQAAAFASLQTAYLQNRVWPTRDTQRNATKLLQAVEGASEDYLQGGPPPGSWSQFLADRIDRHVMR